MDYENPSNDDILREQGYIHESELPDFAQIKDHLKGIIESVYDTGDVAMLESCLDEVCHQFKIKLKNKIPVIQRKEKPLLEWYVDLTRNLKS